MDTRQEFSAGGVVFKKFKISNVKLQIKFLLGKHSGYHKWVLPKGLIEAGESPEQTAVREIKEEMGVEAKIIQLQPIHIEKYSYTASYKKTSDFQSQVSEATRRVKSYQEQDGQDTKVEKTVTFFLLEYLSGDPSQHGWEMEDAGWFTYEETLEKMSFEGEKLTLKKAWELLAVV